MEPWTIKLQGEPYTVRDSLKGYEVIFPDGSYRVLTVEHDGDQNEVFSFDDHHDPELAEELGRLIMNHTT